MRLLHPRTLEIASNRKDIPKTVITHVWSEIFKWKGSGKPHPKMFIHDDYDLGLYLCLIFQYALDKECNLNEDNIKKLSPMIQRGYYVIPKKDGSHWTLLDKYFNDNYLFSDACSLYYKGINIFEDLFPGESQKYIPVISHKEIVRQCNKTVKKLLL